MSGQWLSSPSEQTRPTGHPRARSVALWICSVLGALALTGSNPGRGAEPVQQATEVRPSLKVRLTGPRAAEDRWQLIELATATPARPGNDDRPRVEPLPDGERPSAAASAADERALEPVRRSELHFHSNFGIGGATVESTVDGPGGAKPQRLTLVLHLRGLEQLTLKSGDTELRLAVSHAAPWTTRVSKLESTRPESPLDPADPLFPRVECETEPASDSPAAVRAFRVELPADLLPRPDRPLTVHWIDFFRQ